jgi:hypothetical protein
MKKAIITLLAVAVIAGTGGWAAAYFRAERRRPLVEAKLTELSGMFTPVDFGYVPVLPDKCLYGHQTLKKVKVIYGMPGMLSPQEQAALDNHDIIFDGSCVVGPKSPIRTVFCTTCGFIYGRGLGPWTRESEEAASFLQPFSYLFRSFPLPEDYRRRETRFSQDVQGGIVFAETLSYSTFESPADLKAAVRKWAESFGLQLEPLDLPERTPSRLYDGGDLLTEDYQYFGRSNEDRVYGRVGFITYPAYHKVRIDLSVSLKSPVAKSIDAYYGADSSGLGRGNPK